VKYRLSILLGLVWLAGLPHALRADETSAQFRIVGLFAPERQEDLREVLKEVLDVQLVSVDMDNAEVTLRYDLAKLDPGFNPKKPPTAAQTLERLNNRIAHASHGSFRLTARQTVPKDALTKIEIDIGVLDCKACRFGAYRAVMGVEGVSRATVSASPSRVTAWIDAKKTDRAALEKALTRVGVALASK
jgi:hypothetical protein